MIKSSEMLNTENKIQDDSFCDGASQMHSKMKVRRSHFSLFLAQLRHQV